ncbi:MAG TPA: oligopeptide/dipeptide ABC transporter ATP-binding protein [Rhodopila sp.]|nr:oligopeptide/dipeptide ABC transporter ATP-binding protein [Rhodopila sp.]
MSESLDRGGPAQPLLIARDLRKHFLLRGKGGKAGGLLKRGLGAPARVHAVDGVSFSVAKGETLGVVGESGCGKSTLARLLMHLLPRDQGELILDGDVVGTGGIGVPAFRRQVQMVFQDSSASLNPRLAVRDSIAFGPRIQGHSRGDAAEKARQALRHVSLDPDLIGERYPHELSGGQKQRVNIARALAIGPRMVILDEPVSALDKSVQAQVLNLLARLRRELGLTYIFISHDLGVVRHISQRVLVMYLGQVVEIGPAEALFSGPMHPYTRALLASRPSMDPSRRIERQPVSGDPPNPVDLPPGCRFAPRCRYAEAVCTAGMPPLAADPDRPASGHEAACFIHVPDSGHSLAGRGLPVDEMATGTLQ